MERATRILRELANADQDTAQKLFAAVYDELRGQAARLLASEQSEHMLQATALVHEAYLRLSAPDGAAFHSRSHFFAAAAQAMRRILVESARRRKAARRGSGQPGTTLHESRVASDDDDAQDGCDDEQLLRLDAALAKLALEDDAKATLVHLRFFAGLTEPEAAAAMGISRATASRYWTYARAWLKDEMDRAAQ